jgi:hypothetical protein
MSDITDDEKLFFYDDENGRGAWWDSPDVDSEYEIGFCQNCDAPLTLQQAKRGRLFCSEKCQQTAVTVRYARRTLRDGRPQRDPLVRRAIVIRIAQIPGGGYPKKARVLSNTQREAIFLRDGYAAGSVEHPLLRSITSLGPCPTSRTCKRSASPATSRGWR